MADRLFAIENQEVDVKEYVKIRMKAVVGDTVYLRFYLYEDGNPIKIENYNIEYRCTLPSGNVYSEVDCITKTEGNLLEIECDSYMCSEVGEVIGGLRIWNTEYKQKSSFQIIIKVLSNQGSDTFVNTKSLLSATESLDWAINKYLELKVDLDEGIKSAELLIESLKESVIEGTKMDTQLKQAIKDSKDAINDINDALNNADKKETELKQVIKDTETAINNANTTKTNLENAIADAIEDTNEAKEALSNEITKALTTKSDLSTLIDEGEQLLEDLKNFDTDQIVERTNEMYNEMFALNDLVTLTHNLDAYPVVQVIVTDDGYGIGAYGDCVYGGVSICSLGTYKVKYISKDKLILTVSNNYNFGTPIVHKENDYEYNLTFADDSRSMLIKLLVIETDTNCYLVDEKGNYLVDEKDRYILGY